MFISLQEKEKEVRIHHFPFTFLYPIYATFLLKSHTIHLISPSYVLFFTFSPTDVDFGCLGWWTWPFVFAINWQIKILRFYTFRYLVKRIAPALEMRLKWFTYISNGNFNVCICSLVIRDGADCYYFLKLYPIVF